MRREEQRREALEEGNRVRLLRAAFKRRMREDRTLLVRLLRERPVPDEFRTMSLRKLLLAARHLGPTRTRRIMGQLRLPEGVRLGNVALADRLALADLLEQQIARTKDG